MDFAEQLRVLQAAQGHPAKLAFATVDLNYPELCEADRNALKQALEAAAIPHWCDEQILAQLLKISPEESAARLGGLRGLNVVESFPARGETAVNVPKFARVALRAALIDDSPERFRVLAGRAAKLFENDRTALGRVEWIYHLLCFDPDRGATGLEKLHREWIGSALPEDRYSLGVALEEFEDTGLAQGRARVWVLLVTSRARLNRGESAPVLDAAQNVLHLAKIRADARAEGYAQCLLGDVLDAQGSLSEAQAAYGEYLLISRRLADADPNNAGWQRQLADAHSRVGDVLEAQGRLREAESEFLSELEINETLAVSDPRDTGRQRALAVAQSRLGDVLMAQGKLQEALDAFEAALAICQRSAATASATTESQHDLFVVHRNVAEVQYALGWLTEARTHYSSALDICLHLTEIERTNAEFQRDLAMTGSRVGDLLDAQGDKLGAKSEWEKALAILRELVMRDPSNAGWQRDLAVISGRYGDFLQLLERSDAARTTLESGEVASPQETVATVITAASLQEGNAPHPPARLFICYSSEDQEWKQRLKSTLAILQKKGFILVWQDRMVGAGDDWNSEIQKKLEEADVVLCLVSRHFLASDYIQNHELPKALELHKNGKVRLIPLVLTPCSWNETPLYDLQTATGDRRPVSKWPDPEDAYLKLERQLGNAWRRIRGLPQIAIDDE